MNAPAVRPSAPRYCFVSQTTRLQNPLLDPSVRYRCYHPADELRRDGYRCTVTSAHTFTREPLFDADVYVFHRPTIAQPGMERIIETLKSKGRILFADYDDLIFGGPEVAHQSSQARNGLISPEQAERLFETNLQSMRLFDRFTVSTETLREEVLYHIPNADVQVVPNFLPRSLLQQHERLGTWSRPRPSNRIGYFSGTLSHNKDFETIYQVLMDALRSDHNTTLMLVGPLEVPGDLAALPNSGRHRVVDYAHLPYLMSSFNTVIAPLEDSRFNRCKSRVKFLESSLAGCQLVASPIPDMVSAGSGYAKLAHTEEDWRAALIDRPDPGSLRSRAIRCFERLESMIPEIYHHNFA